MVLQHDGITVTEKHVQVEKKQVPLRGRLGNQGYTRNLWEDIQMSDNSGEEDFLESDGVFWSFCIIPSDGREDKREWTLPTFPRQHGSIVLYCHMYVGTLVFAYSSIKYYYK